MCGLDRAVLALRRRLGEQRHNDGEKFLLLAENRVDGPLSLPHKNQARAVVFTHIGASTTRVGAVDHLISQSNEVQEEAAPLKVRLDTKLA